MEQKIQKVELINILIVFVLVVGAIFIYKVGCNTGREQFEIDAVQLGVANWKNGKFEWEYSKTSRGVPPK